MSNEIDKLFESGNDYFYKNDYENAKKCFLQVIEKDPSHSKAMQKLAKIESNSNNIDKAIEYYENSLKIESGEPAIWNDLGNLYYDKGDFNGAIRCYKKAIEEDDKYYWAFYNIGLALNELYPNDPQKAKEALDWFNKAVEINDNYYPALNEIGLYYLDLKEYDKAEEYFNKSIAANERYKYPFYNLGQIYKHKGDIEKAKEYLYKSLLVDPNYAGAYNNMGILFYDDNDNMTALYYYARANEVEPGYKYALYNIGLVFDRIEKYRKAYEMYKKALNSDPNYEPALEEMKRLESEFPEEIKNGEPLVDSDLKADTYKPLANVYKKQFVKKEEKIENIDEKNKIDSTYTKSNTITEKKDELYVEKYGRNLTRLANEGKLFEVVGRDKEIRELLEVLIRIKKNNPIIVGKAGVGKTAVVEGLAQKIAKGDVPDFFKDMKVIEINIGMLVAGTKYRGEFEDKLKRIINELKDHPDVILFIDEIHTIIGAGETEDSSLDAANILKPALSRGEIRCIGATTTDEYVKYIQKDAAFDRRFYKINVEELDKNSTLEILKKLKGKMEEHYKLTIDESLLQLIVDLSDEEIKNRVFPDKAIDVMEKSFARSVLDGKKIVDELTVKSIVGDFIGIKFLETQEDKGRHLLDMEEFLKSRVFGQDKAIQKISNIIRLTKHKLDLKPYQPDGVFFFAGPTGVGKTYLAKQIAIFLYGTEDKLITVNMSEFTEPHSISKLIGSPPGYVGYNEVSFFTSKIMDNPSCVILLDEIEKAHPEVLKLFLQIFEEGKINDAKGKMVSFSNATVIMTSNAIGINQDHLGFATKDIKSEIKLSEVFPAEFVNRIDEVIIFDFIEKDVAEDILKNLIMKKTINGFSKKGIKLSFDESFAEYILNIGYSRKFGVRNLERTYEKEVLANISNFLFKNPDSKKITITIENNKVVVK
jgi:ATP-dependent Clp protease ATP-binding subunit ClpC